MQAMATASRQDWLAAPGSTAGNDINAAGQNDGETGAPPPQRPRVLTVDDYAAGVIAGDRTVLSRAITLIESNSDLHQAQAQEVLHRLLPRTGSAKRVGITG